MEGNKLGPKTCLAFADLFRTNVAIRHIDLEGNNLTKGGNTEGIKEMAKALENNETLLCLNLSNTNLNAECGTDLERMLEKNKTIIMLDVSENPELKIS